MGINAHGRKGGGTVKAKHQRLILALAALSAVVGSGVLAMSGLKDRASYFYAPGDVARQGIPSGAIRLGGMVTNGSLVKAPDGVTLSFVVHDENNQVPVRFRGIPPDLFKEAFDGQTFVASNLLAKHDENYKPPQMAGKEHKTDTLKP
jgi:cytochrome c-type biogenesis protein CcmE